MGQSMSRSGMQQWASTSILLLAVSLASCKPPAPETTPKGPEITVASGNTVSVRAYAKGATGYEWSLQVPGRPPVSRKGETFPYTASEEGGLAILTVTARNAWGASPPTVLTISPPATVSLDQLVMMPQWVWCDPNEQPGDLEISPANCYTGLDCLRFTYQAGGKCGGFHWRPLCVASAVSSTSPIPSWPFYVAHIVPGGECSIDVLKAGNLSEVSRLVFWVRGEKGGEFIQFGVGAPNMEPIPGRSTDMIMLQPVWEPYEIDLRGLNLTAAEVLFRWCATDVHNPQGAVFYLDDVRFEGTRK